MDFDFFVLYSYNYISDNLMSEKGYYPELCRKCTGKESSILGGMIYMCAECSSYSNFNDDSQKKAD